MIVVWWVLLLAAPAAAFATGRRLVRANPDRFVVLDGRSDLSALDRLALTVLLIAAFVAAFALDVDLSIVLVPAEVVVFGVCLYVPVMLHNRRLARARAGLPTPDLPSSDPRDDRVMGLLAAFGGALLGTGAVNLVIDRGAGSHPVVYGAWTAAGVTLAGAAAVRWRRHPGSRPNRP